MTELNDLTQKGEDISTHYLNESAPFRVFRYQGVVYAVSYQNDKPVDLVEMWKSHKGKKNDIKDNLVGKGLEGKVVKKTEDKYQKTKHFSQKEATDPKMLNEKILKQKFLLHRLGVDKYFALGLWNIKDENNPVLNMPAVKAEKADLRKEETKQDLVEFILALKKVNQAGYAHDDLANTPYHKNYGNIIVTTEGVKLIDMDNGLKSIEDQSNAFQKAYIKDQWLYVYNLYFGEKDDLTGDWRKNILDWYKQNQNKSLSESPRDLNTLSKSKKILLPSLMLVELSNFRNLENAKQAVAEYRSGSLENRKHRYHEVSIKDLEQVERFKTQISELKNEYNTLSGDALKRSILNELKDSLSEINDIDSLNSFKEQFMSSPKMAILDKAQGIATEILQHVGFKTDSHKAVDAIFKKAEERCTNSPAP